jgi:hypothetical protein
MAGQAMLRLAIVLRPAEGALLLLLVAVLHWLWTTCLPGSRMS